MEIEPAELYPSNLALAEELVRLFFNPPIRRDSFSAPESFTDAYGNSSENCRSIESNGGDHMHEYKNTKKFEKRGKVSKECGFCKNNGEQEIVYKHHTLRNEKGAVACPVLRAYNCPLCNNNGGDNAHTVRYCPLNSAPEAIPTVTSLKTRRTSTGKRRKETLYKK